MDYISKTDAINALLSKGHFAAAKTLWYFPAADVEERKVGKWIDTGSGQECSLCNEIQYGHDNFRYFCPNCGAKMEG